MEIYRGSRGKTPLILDVGARRKRGMTYCHERWVALSFGRETWRFATNCYFHLQGRRLWPILSPKCSVYLFTFLLMYSIIFVNRDSSVGAANRDGLDGPGIETRWGWGFPHPPKPALGPHTASCTICSLFPGGKAARAGRWPTTPSSDEVKGRVKLYLYSPSGT